MSAIPNDVDIEMAELAEAGASLANGICPLCDDIVDPFAPKWTDADLGTIRLLDGSSRQITRAEFADMVGPHEYGYHSRCLAGD